MTLVSPSYWFFFTLVLLFFYNSPTKMRWRILLISGLFFYSSIIPIYSLILVYQALIVYIYSKYVLINKINSNKKFIFYLAIFISLLPLLFFKSLPLFNQALESALKSLIFFKQKQSIDIIIPVGISFFTFSTVGYIIDIYNQKFEFKAQFGKILLFISFFPIVLSGPIERGNFIEQLDSKFNFKINLLISGSILILWGSFMKLVLANNIDLLIGPILEDPNSFNGKSIFFAILIFPFQVYGDLGGYSLIAIGSAKCFGIKIRENFNNPFSSTSMTDFWRRWHISLIQWINDYIFKPIVFYNRGLKKLGVIIGLLFTFIVAGLWHGITYGFLIWGVFQAIVLTLEFLFKLKKEYFNYKLVKYIRRIFTYLIFSFSLIFGGAFSGLNNSIIALKKMTFTEGDLRLDQELVLICILSIIIVLFKDFYYIKKLKHLNKILKWIVIQFIILSILFFGVFNQEGFIYFQY